MTHFPAFHTSRYTLFDSTRNFFAYALTLIRYAFQLWVPYNKAKKHIDRNREGMKQVVREMYTKAGVVIPPVGRRVS